jgi:microcystin-dependent protein
MPDSVSSLLQLTLQQTGGNENTWGDILNAQLEKLEQAISGMTTVSTTGGDTTLTDDQARPALIEITGGISSNVNVIVPARTKQWTIVNRTAGNFPVRIKTASGTGYALPKDLPCVLFCDGDDVYPTDGAGSVPIGCMVYALSTTVPDNYIEANGAAISRTTYARLFAVLGTTWGIGNGTSTFNLPDHSDRYMRGRSGTNVLGTLLDQAIQSHTHAGSVAEGGTHSHTGTTGAAGSHSHTYDTATGTGGAAGSGNLLRLPVEGTTSTAADHTHTISLSGGGHTHTFTTDATGGTETRPKTLVAMALIRYQ